MLLVCPQVLTSWSVEFDTAQHNLMLKVLPKRFITRHSLCLWLAIVKFKVKGWKDWHFVSSNCQHDVRVPRGGPRVIREKITETSMSLKTILCL